MVGRDAGHPAGGHGVSPTQVTVGSGDAPVVGIWAGVAFDAARWARPRGMVRRLRAGGCRS